MNEIIKIDNDNKVSGRELHEFLKVGTAYKDWFPRMTEYGFVEGTDFCSKMSEYAYLLWLNNNTFCKKYPKMVKKYLDRLLNNHYTEIVVRE